MLRSAIATFVVALAGFLLVTHVPAGHAQSTGARTLELASKTGAVTFVDLPPRARTSHSPPSRGDLLVFTRRVSDASGAALGTMHVVCSVTKPNTSIETAVYQCTGAYALRDGTLTVESVAAIVTAKRVTAAVTGGTGAYEGARGSVTVVQSGETSHDTVHLLD